MVAQGHGIAHPRIMHRLDRRSDIADLAGIQAAARLQTAGTHDAGFHHIELRTGGHHADRVTGMHLALLDADVDDHPTVAVVITVENQRLQRLLFVAAGCGYMPYHRFEHRFDIGAHFSGNQRRIRSVDADDILDFLPHPLRLCRGQVDLVDNRHNLQTVVHRKVGVRQRLRLYALRRVHHKDGALAGRQRPRYLIVEVHMARCINQIEYIIHPVLRAVGQGDGVRLDGNAALTFEIHTVQQLILHIAQRHRLGFLQDAVGKGRFAVVDMGDDAEIADMLTGNVHENDSFLSAVRKSGTGFAGICRVVSVYHILPAGDNRFSHPQRFFRSNGQAGPHIYKQSLSEEQHYIRFRGPGRRE